MNLFIDTHLNDIIIILSENGKIIREKTILNEKQNSKNLMPAIKKILDKGKPDSITIVNGPGSFTGVRLGVTVAKTLAYTLNIPIRTITSLECIALSIEEKDKIVAFSDNNGYYIGIFNEEIELIGNYEYISNTEFLEYSKKHLVIQNVKINYEKAIKFANKKANINAHEVNPVYIKKIDVEK